jgi:hypothetical protein
MSESIRFECRNCKKITEQIERIVTDNLPANVKVLQCKVCSKMSVCLLVTYADA